MPRPKLEVVDIFRAYGPAYRRENAGHLNLPQLKVMSTARQGIAEQCPERGDRDLPHRCARRACRGLHQVWP